MQWGGVTPRGLAQTTKSLKHLPYHGQINLSNFANEELFVISVTVQYMHGELLSEISWV